MEAVDEYEAASSAVDQMPPGFRFHPTDCEVIDYLLNKVIDRCFRAVAIGEINLNICEPWDLPKNEGENERFFFFEKETKYPSGIRTNRATPSGYWKATGKDKEIYKGKKSRQIVGMKKTLVFYKGRAPKGEKTSWVIHEYRLKGDFSAYNNFSNDAKEKWVVCRVFHKKNGVNIDPIPGAVQLGRVDSVVDRYILDSPTPLPPLTDYSSDHQKPSSSFVTDQELDQNNYFFSPNPVTINSNFNQYSTNLNPNPYYSTQNLHLNSVPNLANQQQNGINFSPALERYHPIPFKGGGDDHKPNSRILESDVYIGGKEPERIMCKMEEYSGVSAAELESESKQCDGVVVDDEEYLCFSPNISDLDSLWSC